MPTSRTRPTKTIPTLRDLCLDHIAAIAAELRKADPTLTKEQSIAKAATTPEGREAHRLYNAPGSDLQWTQYLQKAARKANVKLGPADAVFAKIRSEAMRAAPEGRSEPESVADFLQTAQGQTLWRRYNAARRIEND